MDHLRIFNLQAELTKAYSEPLYLNSNLWKSSKESYSEDRVAFAFDNSFGKDVPGVSAGTTYDKEDKEEMEKAVFIDDDLSKGIDAWDVANVAIWFIPGGWIIRGGKAIHKLGSMAFGAKKLYKPIKAVYGAKKAHDYAKATHKGAKATNKFLTGLQSTKQMKNMNSVRDASVSFLRASGAGKYGSAGAKAADSFMIQSAGRAGAAATRNHGLLGRTAEMARQGHHLTPAQQTITNLEMYSTVGNLALKQAPRVLPKVESARQKAARAWGADKVIRESGRRGAANVDKEVLATVFKGTPLATHTTKVTVPAGKPVIVGVPTMPKPKIAEPVLVSEEVAKVSPSALKRMMTSTKPVPVPASKKDTAKKRPAKKRPAKKRRLPAGKGDTWGYSRGSGKEDAHVAKVAAHTPLYVEKEKSSSRKASSKTPKHRARASAKAGKIGGRYRYSERPVTWKEVQAEAKGQA